MASRSPRAQTALVHEPPVAQEHRGARHRGLDAAPGDGLEVGGVGQREPAGLGLLDDGLAQGMLRAPLGRRRQAQEFVRAAAPSAAPPPAAADASPASTMSVTSGLPRVSVPVLSSTMAFSLYARSSASPERMRMPFSAPLPVPTTMAVGVARPMAQGQAMITTVTNARRPG